MDGCEACARPGGKKRSLLAVVFLCAHCSATALLGLGTLALAGAPALFGVGLQWILPPLLIGGVLAFLMWPARPLEHVHP